MGRNTTVYASVDIDVDFDDLDTKDLIDELQDRGYHVYEGDRPASVATPADPSLYRQLIEQIYHQKRQGKPVEAELDRLIYDVLGRVI